MFDNLTIYCLATGKPIAAVSDDEVGVIIDALAHIPVEKQGAHLDRLALLSMRPSLLWMNVTPASLDSIREAAPKQLLAYLANRMFAPIERPNRPGILPNIDSILAAHRMRIAMWQTIESHDFAPGELDQLLVLLLLLDSRFNLTRVTRPSYVTESWSNLTTLIESLTKWHNALSIDAEKAARRAKMANEFWNNGGNRLAQEPAKKQFAKVMPSKTAIIRKEKAVKLAGDVDFLTQLERELTVRSSVDSAASSVKARVIPVVKTAIMRFGVKKEA